MLAKHSQCVTKISFLLFPDNLELILEPSNMFDKNNVLLGKTTTLLKNNNEDDMTIKIENGIQ